MTPSDVFCEAVAGWLGERTPLVVGVCAAQGAGKSTLCRTAKAAGIVVTNTPDVLTEATADIALMLML
ncbi:MAG TPA: D-glycerate dehydrogenase, partial [Asticcacaulis sp.]